jgi:sec-independent protein translocase protein TatB
MFDIGFPELLIVSVVALLIFGPERLPEVLRTVGRWFGAARRSFTSLKDELEREVGADEIRRDLHNNRIMEEARRLEQQVASSRDEVEELLGKRYTALKDSGAVEGETPADETEKENRGDAAAPDGPDAADAPASPAVDAEPDAGAGPSTDRRDDRTP